MNSNSARIQTDVYFFHNAIHIARNCSYQCFLRHISIPEDLEKFVFFSTVYMRDGIELKLNSSWKCFACGARWAPFESDRNRCIQNVSNLTQTNASQFNKGQERWTPPQMLCLNFVS